MTDKWIVRWDDCGEENEVEYDSLGRVIDFIQTSFQVAETVDRVRIFLNEDHVATYTLPIRGYWS